MLTGASLISCQHFHFQAGLASGTIAFGPSQEAIALNIEWQPYCHERTYVCLHKSSAAVLLHVQLENRKCK